MSIDDSRRYKNLDHGRFAYRRDQLWNHGNDLYSGRLVEFRKDDPMSRAVVEAIDEEWVIFQMLRGALVNVCGS